MLVKSTCFVSHFSQAFIIFRTVSRFSLFVLFVWRGKWTKSFHPTPFFLPDSFLFFLFWFNKSRIQVQRRKTNTKTHFNKLTDQRKEKKKVGQSARSFVVEFFQFYLMFCSLDYFCSFLVSYLTFVETKREKCECKLIPLSEYIFGECLFVLRNNISSSRIYESNKKIHKKSSK